MSIQSEITTDGLVEEAIDFRHAVLALSAVAADPAVAQALKTATYSLEIAICRLREAHGAACMAAARKEVA